MSRFLYCTNRVQRLHISSHHTHPAFLKHTPKHIPSRKDFFRSARSCVMVPSRSLVMHGVFCHRVRTTFVNKIVGTRPMLSNAIHTRIDPLGRPSNIIRVPMMKTIFCRTVTTCEHTRNNTTRQSQTHVSPEVEPQG